MTIYDYIASKNPKGANELLSNYGFNETSSSSTLSTRLKAIVRKYKKLALQEISLIHPDTGLLSNFTTSTLEDSDFAYASGVRSPEFMSEPEEEEIPVKDTGFVPTPPPPSAFSIPLPTPPPIPQKVLDLIQDLKYQVKSNRDARKQSEKREMDRLNLGNVSGFSQTNLLMCAVAFALGYMIAKKQK